LRYAVVTPARNEAVNLPRLALSLAAQTALPSEWIVVDDGSTDGTDRVAAALASEHDWMSAFSTAGVETGPLASGCTSGREVLVFNEGVERLSGSADVVVKVDADVSFEPDYFQRLLAEFDADATLGIASGTCYERDRGEWRPRHATRVHARGASRAYRRRCLQDVSPLEVRLGWDGIDVLKATVRGWRTRSFPHLRFFHHRPVRRDGSVRTWITSGHTAHYLGYRGSYLVLRALHHSRRDPAALGLLLGYGKAALWREERLSDPEVHAFLREYQSLRQLPARVREARGRG
jgi:poly-beta-1,6-N-acetyl-D-glucosamine synthase